MRIRNLISMLVVLTLVLAACGTDGDESAPGADPTTTSVVADPGGRGWLDGSPAEADERATSDRGGDLAVAEAAGAETAADVAVDEAAPAI